MNKEESTRAVISQLWLRARINAFAHRSAFEYLSQKGKKYFIHELCAVLISLLFLILVFAVGNSDFITSKVWKSALSLFFTIMSVTGTLYALYRNTMAIYIGFAVKAENHRNQQNRYLHLAQRAREAKWPSMPDKQITILMHDLEREFQILKAIGPEPEDIHFDKSHIILEKIKKDSDSRIAQSYDIGAPEEAGQHVGEPHLDQANLGTNDDICNDEFA